MQTSTRLRLYLVFIPLACVTCGCGGPYAAEGTVRFSDGAPLPGGRVVVDWGPDSKVGSWGLIHPDGSFVIGTNEADDGLPLGTYRVYLMNVLSELPREYVAPRGGPGGGASLPDRLNPLPNESGSTGPPPLVDPKYMSPETSGLTFEVKKASTWEIVIERPTKKKP